MSPAAGSLRPRQDAGSMGGRRGANKPDNEINNGGLSNKSLPLKKCLMCQF